MGQDFYVVSAFIDYEGVHSQWVYPSFDMAFDAYDAQCAGYRQARGEDDIDAFVPDSLQLSGPYAWGEDIFQLGSASRRVLRSIDFR